MTSFDSTSSTIAVPPHYMKQDMQQIQQQQFIYPEKPQQLMASQFPQSFVFEKTSISDLVLCSVPDATNRNQEIYYVATHRGWSSKPDVVLHCRPTPSCPALCTATFKTFSSQITLQVGDQVTDLLKDGVFTITHSFTTHIPQTGKNERFEWRRSSGPEIAALGGRSTGMKLVRVMTGEIVAVYTGVRMSLSKKGKMAFLNSGAQGFMGQSWDLLAVISLLAIQEKNRRRNKNGATAGAASSGGGGSGGC